MENTTQQNLNWIDEEVKQLGTPLEGERLPALKFTPNKVIELDVDFSKPFYKWLDKIHKSTKAVIPVTCAGTKYSFWLNIKNPIFRQLLDAGKKGQTHFKIIQTGTAQDTRYNFVE